MTERAKILLKAIAALAAVEAEYSDGSFWPEDERKIAAARHALETYRARETR